MNKSQFNRLKKALDQGKSNNNAASVDAQIRQLAQQKAAEIRAEQRQKAWFRRKAMSFASAFSLAITITAASLLIMSHLTAVPELELFADTPSTTLSNERQSTITIARSIDSLPPGMLATPVVRAQSRFYSADEILQEFSLPSPTALARRMNLDTSADRWAIVSSLSSALADISAMIGVGEFEQARQRYQRLRQSCANCQLPNSLEELTLVSLAPEGNI